MSTTYYRMITRYFPGGSTCTFEPVSEPETETHIAGDHFDEYTYTVNSISEAKMIKDLYDDEESKPF